MKKLLSCMHCDKNSVLLPTAAGVLAGGLIVAMITIIVGKEEL